MGQISRTAWIAGGRASARNDVSRILPASIITGETDDASGKSAGLYVSALLTARLSCLLSYSKRFASAAFLLLLAQSQLALAVYVRRSGGATPALTMNYSVSL